MNNSRGATRVYCPYTKLKIVYTKCPQGYVMLPSSGWKLNYVTKYVNSVCLSFFVKKTILLPSHTLWGGSRRGFKSRLHLLKGEFLWVDFCIWTKDSIWVDVPINCSSSVIFLCNFLGWMPLNVRNYALDVSGCAFRVSPLVNARVIAQTKVR